MLTATEPVDAPASFANSMAAVVNVRYGPPGNAILRRISAPTPKRGEVRIRVRAAGIHIGDCFAARGRPLPVRAMTGWFRPTIGIPGFDLAGEVDAIGAGVAQIQVGDRVFGCGRGTCAELALAQESTLTPIPDSLDFEVAAAIPTSGLAALHALRETAQLTEGQLVLVNGAAGGVGHFAVQLAKHFGAEVTGVCSSKRVEFVRALGADHVIDYTKNDFTRDEARYDVILDNVENHSLGSIRQAAKRDGTIILNSGSGSSGLRFWIRFLEPLARNPFTSQRLLRYMSTPNSADLALLGRLVIEGEVTPAISRVVPLEEVPHALTALEEGHGRGKTVVRIA